MEIDLDVYNDAKYASDADIGVLFSSIKSDLELQLYSLYSSMDTSRDTISQFLGFFESYVLNRQTIATYVNQLLSWLNSMYKFPTDANATLIASVDNLMEQFMTIEAKLLDNTFTGITLEQTELSRMYFTENTDKAPSEPFSIMLKRPQHIEPWNKFSEIVIDTVPPMQVRVPFGAVVTIDRNTQMYRYIVPNMPTHGKVYIWPDNVKQTFAFGTRVTYKPGSDTESGQFTMIPIVDYEALPALVDNALQTSYYGKVIVLPLTLQSIEVMLPENLDTIIYLYDTTTEIRAFATPTTLYPGKVTLHRNELSQSFQLLNPTDIATLSYSGDVLFVSNIIMPIYEQVLPEFVDDATSIFQTVPVAMPGLPLAPETPIPLPVESVGYTTLSQKMAERMVNIERASNAIDKTSSLVYAQVLYAQASDVHTTVLRLLNFGEAITNLQDLIQSLKTDMVNLIAMANAAWLTAEQYDGLYGVTIENQAIVSQALAMAYSVLVINAVVKPQILALWNDWLNDKNNTAFEALKKMRAAARYELLQYGIVFSEADTIPSEELIDAIILLKTRPTKIDAVPEEKKETISVYVVFAIFFGSIVVMYVLAALGRKIFDILDARRERNFKKMMNQKSKT